MIPSNEREPTGHPELQEREQIMKYTMAKTQQFGDHHFKKGERVFVRPIHGTNNVILSRMKHQPNGHTVSRDWLRELVVAEPTEPQQVIETTTVAGKAPHTFRHVGSVELNGRRVRAYLMDHLPEARYYVLEDGKMRGLRTTEWTAFKSREED